LESRRVLAVFTVNSLADAPDINPGDGLALDAAGQTTLRAAIMEANGLPGSDSITLGPGAYSLSIPGANENASATGDLDITSNLTITGAGAQATIIHGAQIDRLFHILIGASASISGVTIRNGRSDSGGGIYNAGALTVSSSRVIENSSTDSFGGGGGICNAGGQLDVDDCVIAENDANFSGGGILNDFSTSGIARLRRTTVSGNSAGWGGGIKNEENMLLANCTISGNSASFGGGVDTLTGGVTLTRWMTIDNCTFTGNSGAFGTGGIRNWDNTQPVTVVTARNSIFAGNTGDVRGHIASQGHNLIGNSSGGLGFVPTDLLNVNPLLGPLQDNGGPTLTHALLTGSPARDAGDNANALLTDQRGLARIADGDGNGTATIDIGAVEMEAVAAAPSVVLSLAGSPLAESGGQATVTATLSAASSQNVTVALGFSGTASHPADYARSGNQIVIPAGQTTGSITLSPQQDPQVEGDETIVIDIAAVTNGVELGTQQVSATITDDDAAGFTMVESGGNTTVSEAGGADTFTVVLSARPLTNVVLTITSDDTTEATVSPATLTFPPNEWNIPRTVTVTGVDDGIVDGDQTSTITVAVDDAASDDRFDSLANQSAAVTTADDDAEVPAFSFAPAQVYAVGNTLSSNVGISVGTGDFDQNGAVDLVSGNFGPDSISLFPGDGAGSYGTRTDIQDGRYHSGVSVGDFNGDGHPDLVLPDVGDYVVSVLLADGAGGFAPRTDYIVGLCPSSVAIGDLNHDGHLDLAAAKGCGSSYVAILLGRGDGTFQQAVNYDSGGASSLVVGNHYIAIGDLNRDSHPDLAIANHDSTNVAILYGDGTGSFGAPQTLAPPRRPSSIAIADVNSDGKLDLIAGLINVQLVAVFLGDGAGGFTAPQSFGTGPSDPTYTHSSGVVVQDLNGDGALDLAIANSGMPDVAILPGLGNGSFGPNVNFGLGFTFSAGGFSIRSDDLNSDGLHDLVVGAYGRQVSVLLNDASVPPTLVAPAGPEFRVNTTTAGDQVTGRVAMDADGNFVVAWRGDDGSGFGVFAQRFDVAGVPQGPEFRVNTTTQNSQEGYSVAMDADGDFVVVWQSLGQDGGSWGTYGQRYNAAGQPLGSEFLVNTVTDGSQLAASVAMDASGDFVVVWQQGGGGEGGIFAQRYNSAGERVGDEFPVNTTTAANQNRARVAMNDAGDFVIAWQSQDAESYGIYARRYNAAGVPQGDQFRVNTLETGSQDEVSIASDAAGDFIVAWHSQGQDGDGLGIYARRYGATGLPQGAEFAVNMITAGSQADPRVAMDSAGGFVVTWHSEGQDGNGSGVLARRYDAAGAAMDSEFQVNTFAVGHQLTPDVAVDADGDFVVTWYSAQDGDGFGVYGRRYTHEGPNPVQIADDSGPGFSTTEDWASGGGPGIGRGNNVHIAFGESFLPADIATWTVNLPEPGRYRISSTWYTNPFFTSLWSNGARFEVLDGSTVLGTSVINMQDLPNDFNDAGSAWEDLGYFEVMGSTLTIRLLTGHDDKYVIADAVRVERVADLPPAEISLVMNGETGIGIPDGTGHADFGAVDFHDAVQKTFTISNRGTTPLSLTLPVTVTGAAFSVVQQPALSTLAPGQSTTFVIEMSGAVTGVRTGTVTFGNGDSDENPFNFAVSGTVRTTKIIDDGDPGFFTSPAPIQPGGWGQAGGPGREFDYHYNRNHPGVDEYVTWTFNVTPGVYRVSTTWPFGSPGYDDAAPFTIFDGMLAGGVVVGGRNINQKVAPDDTDYPPGFMFPAGTSGATNWERIDEVTITGDTLTVRLQANDAAEFVLADSVMIDRLGDLPPDIVLGSFSFNSQQFGDTLIESDGGAYSDTHWLNIVDANPGNPAYLTGANFDTGVANIHSNLTLTIGYSNAIINGAGDDFGVVVARYDEVGFRLAVSTDGTTFTAPLTILASSAVDSGEDRAYFYGLLPNDDPFPASLFVHSLDLSSFGIADGQGIVAIQITNAGQLDLIRVAGFGDTTSQAVRVRPNHTSQLQAIDQFLTTTDWAHDSGDDELGQIAAHLAIDSGRNSPSNEPAVIRSAELEEDELELALTDWLG
jgi:hypothetical protein